MARFQALLATILLTYSLAANALAAPSSQSSYDSPSTYGVVRLARRGVDFKTYYPASTFEVNTSFPVIKPIDRPSNDIFQDKDQ